MLWLRKANGGENLIGVGKARRQGAGVGRAAGGDLWLSRRGYVSDMMSVTCR